MTLIGRVVARGAAAAGAIGAALAIALAPQPGIAKTVNFDEHSSGTGVQTSEPAPSAACVAARNAFVAAVKADFAEDKTERALAETGANTNDPTEDQNETANFKTQRTALVKACEPQEAAETHQGPTAPTPSASCTSAKAALKAFFAQLQAQEKADWTSGTEGTAADKTEDQNNFNQLKALWQAAASACGFNTFDSR